MTSTSSCTRAVWSLTLSRQRSSRRGDARPPSAFPALYLFYSPFFVIPARENAARGRQTGTATTAVTAQPRSAAVSMEASRRRGVEAQRAARGHVVTSQPGSAGTSRDVTAPRGRNGSRGHDSFLMSRDSRPGRPISHAAWRLLRWAGCWSGLEAASLGRLEAGDLVGHQLPGSALIAPNAHHVSANNALPPLDPSGIPDGYIYTRIYTRENLTRK